MVVLVDRKPREPSHAYAALCRSVRDWDKVQVWGAQIFMPDPAHSCLMYWRHERPRELYDGDRPYADVVFR